MNCNYGEHNEIFAVVLHFIFVFFFFLLFRFNFSLLHFEPFFFFHYFFHSLFLFLLFPNRRQNDDFHNFSLCGQETSRMAHLKVTRIQCFEFLFHPFSFFYSVFFV